MGLYHSSSSSKSGVLNDSARFWGFKGRIEQIKGSLLVKLTSFSQSLFPSKRHTHFPYQNHKLSYHHHQYNKSSLNERTIEIPIALHHLHSPPKNLHILEIGAVLPHYTRVKWTVLDKFEPGEHILNQDIIDYHPSKRFDFIFSISSLEHIGYDDDTLDPQKFDQAIHHIKSNLLTSKGTLIATLPLGYNPHVDQILFDPHQQLFTKTTFYSRQDIFNNWQPTTQKLAQNARYNHPFNNANCVCVASIQPLSQT